MPISQINIFLFFIFFYVGTSSGVHLLTTFYGPYFNHKLHITLSNFFKFLRMPERRIHIGIIYLYSNSNKSVTYFHWKILTLAGIWTPDLPGTKPKCYQLSYPGLDHELMLSVHFLKILCCRKTLSDILYPSFLVKFFFEVDERNLKCINAFIVV